jgi:hypothetical protein
MEVRMFRFVVLLGSLIAAGVATQEPLAQEPVLTRAAVVALTDDPVLREKFETRLVARARNNSYDAVTSFDIVPDVQDVDNRGFVDELRAHGIQLVLMLRPAALGEGSSIESVRAEIAPEMFEKIREFAGEVSASGPDDLIAVVHMAIYTIDDDGAHLLSAGAVWLDEPVEDEDEGIERLQDLIEYNINAVRPAIRRHLGLPPLE